MRRTPGPSGTSPARPICRSACSSVFHQTSATFRPSHGTALPSVAARPPTSAVASPAPRRRRIPPRSASSWPRLFALELRGPPLATRGEPFLQVAALADRLVHRFQVVPRRRLPELNRALHECLHGTDRQRRVRDDLPSDAL